jgi:hypothetical protein
MSTKGISRASAGGAVEPIGKIEHFADAGNLGLVPRLRNSNIRALWANHQTRQEIARQGADALYSRRQTLSS